MTSSRSDVKVLYLVTVSGFSYAGDSSVPFLILQCGPLGWKPPVPTTIPSRQGPGDKAVTCRRHGPCSHLARGRCGDKCPRRPLLAQALRCLLSATASQALVPGASLRPVPTPGHWTSGLAEESSRGRLLLPAQPPSCRMGLAGICSRSPSNTLGCPEVTAPLGCRIRFPRPRDPPSFSFLCRPSQLYVLVAFTVCDV